MARGWRAATLLIGAGFLCGCGTAANLSVGIRDGWQYAPVYGGVRRDVQSGQDFYTHNWTSGPNLDLQQNLGTVVGLGLVGIDVPLSAIGDTLTLPIVLPASLLAKSRSGASAPNGNPAPPPTAPVAIVPPPEPPPTPTVPPPPGPTSPPRSNPDNSLVAPAAP